MSRPAKRGRVADDSDSDDDDFVFKYNEDGELVGTAEEEAADRAMLTGMSEVDRESVKLERVEEREKAREIWDLQRRKREEKRLKEAVAAAPAGRRRGPAANAQQKKALQKLSAQRKASRRQSKRSDRDDDEDEVDYSDEMEEEEEEDELDSEDDDEYVDPDAPKGRKGKGRGRGAGASAAASAAAAEYAEMDEDDEDAAEATLDAVQQIRLSRHKLEKWCHEPFFDDLVEGCFVRIGIGVNNETGQTTYRCAQIVSVVERQPYSFGTTRTNKALKLRHGDQERNFRMEFVSNAKIEANEFRKWREAMMDNDLQLATRGHVERKLKAIEEAINYQHTTHDVQKMVEQKQRTGASVGNSRIRIRLLEEKIAEKNERLAAMEEGGDMEEISRLYQEVKAMEDELATVRRKADELRQDRQAQYEKINEVNERNRQRNLVAKKATMKLDAASERRAKAPMVVSLQMTSSPAKKPEDKDEKAGDGKDDGAAAAADPATEVPSFSLGPRRDSAEALREAHSAVKVDIDVPGLDSIPDMPLAAPAAAAPERKVPMRKGLGFLAAYKKSNGLI